MLRIRINGEEVALDLDGLPRFTDLVELIKASIDPDHIITALYIDERELVDEEWGMTLSQLKGEWLDVLTGTPDEYVADKIKDASLVVRSCYLEFRDARKGFQDGDTQEGNRKLKVAVDTLKAFFEWYGTITQLVPVERRDKLDITPYVKDISESCKKICQQQLYQSWWALGESLEKDLEPQLDKLEDVCRRVVKFVEIRA